MATGELLTLPEAVAILRRGWREILLAAVGTTVLGLLFVFLQPTVYSATTELRVVTEVQQESLPFWQAVEGEEPSPVELAEDIRSRPVTEQVLEHVVTELPPQEFESKVSVRPVGNTDLFEITVTDPQRAAAAAIADRYAEEFLEVATGDDQPFDPDVTFEGDLVTSAVAPKTPVSPRPVRTTVLAIIVGVVLGVVAAFGRDWLDTVLRTEDQVRRVMGPELPTLGRIPHHGKDRIPVSTTPVTLAAEAYENLAANVRHLLVRSGTDSDAAGSVPTPASRGHAVVVSSAQARDGRTTVATNLAVATAMAGRNVILVDANLHRAGVAAAFGLSTDNGLVDVVADDKAIDDVLVASGVDGLTILPAGSGRADPRRVLASPRMDELANELRDHADVVIYDTPPLLPVPDALDMLDSADAALWVVRLNHTRDSAVSLGIERLIDLGLPLAGIVVNDVPEAVLRKHFHQEQYSPVRIDQDDHVTAGPTSRPTPQASPQP